MQNYEIQLQLFLAIKIFCLQKKLFKIRTLVIFKKRRYLRR